MDNFICTTGGKQCSVQRVIQSFFISDNFYSFCKEDVETMQHIFISCSEMLTFLEYSFRKSSKRIGFHVINVIFK